MLIVIISTGCLLCAILFLLALNALLEGTRLSIEPNIFVHCKVISTVTMILLGFLLWHTIAYIHIITMINMNCALWYINCRGIKVAAVSLSDSFRVVIKL